MKNIITYETLHSFAYSNDHLIQGEIKGIVVEFSGLNNIKTYAADTADGKEYAERGIILLIPYNNPWCWMNEQAVAYTDELISVLCHRYSLGKDVKIVSTGGSMGGLCALTYCVYASVTPVACVANCPVCDLAYHYTERPDLPRTLYSALADFDGTLDEALRSRSPLHLAERMPCIPYTLFHCECDLAVSPTRHSVPFVQKMEQLGHRITLEMIPHRGHCDLSAEARLRYRKAVCDALL